MENKTILVVDDTVANLDILEELLEQYDTISAICGKDAIQIAKDDDVDLILLDIMMPEMDGYEVCEKLKANDATKNIPIIFITAKADEDSIEKAYDVGGIDYVTKPFKVRELLSKIKTYLSLQELQEKEFQHKKLISLSNLIHNIAHQWRQPLSVISTAATSMKLQKELGILPDEEFYEFCTAIDDNAQYLSNIIDDFRDIIEDNRIKQKFNLKDNIDSFLDLIRYSIKDHNINIILDLQEDIKIDGYENELTQCLISILDNAQDILKEKDIEDKFIFISTSIINDKVIIAIKDNGGGISKDILDKIFEPYFTTKHRFVGTGLGLTMAYNLIVDAMNGAIDVTTQTYTYKDIEYTGAEFIVTLPLS